MKGKRQPKAAAPLLEFPQPMRSGCSPAEPYPHGCNKSIVTNNAGQTCKKQRATSSKPIQRGL